MRTVKRALACGDYAVTVDSAVVAAVERKSLPDLVSSLINGTLLQVRWPGVPIVFCETRQLAEEWTYRYLAAAHAWASTETRPRSPHRPDRRQIRSGGTWLARA